MYRVSGPKTDAGRCMRRKAQGARRSGFAHLQGNQLKGRASKKEQEAKKNFWYMQDFRNGQLGRCKRGQWRALTVSMAHSWCRRKRRHAGISEAAVRSWVGEACEWSDEVALRAAFL